MDDLQTLWDLWRTAETVDVIGGRMWYLNLNLIVTNVLLAALIVTMRGNKK